MLLQLLYGAGLQISKGVQSAILHSILVQVILSLLLPLVLWRTLYFPIRLFLSPCSPKELPYWIPVLGHARAFLMNSEALISRGCAYFGGSRAPFAMTLGGQKLYVVTSVDDITAIYRRLDTFSRDDLLEDLLLGFGVKKAAIGRLWEPLPVETLRSSRNNPDTTALPQLSLIHSMMDLSKRQLLPGPKFDVMIADMIAHLTKSLQWPQLCSSYNTGPQLRLERVSLLQFCSKILVDGTTMTLFGSGIYKVDPRMTQNLVEFIEQAWMLMVKHSHGEKSPFGIARARLLEAFTQYLRGDAHLHQGQSWVVRALLSELQHLDITDQDRSAMLIMIYFGANINPYRLGFWILSYLLFDPDLLAAVKEETALAFQDDRLDTDYLLNRCPLLTATYHECMRLCNTSIAARRVSTPTTLSDRLLQRGSTIIIPIRELHYDSHIFGSDSAEFRPQRFLDDPNLVNSKSFRPFGGGTFLCPGRYFARQEIVVFLAIVLARLDIKLSKGIHQQFPRYDNTTPAIGINGPQHGMDLFVDFIRPAANLKSEM